MRRSLPLPLSLSLEIASFIEQFFDKKFYTLKLGSFLFLATVTFLPHVIGALASLPIASFIVQFLDKNFYTLKLGSFALALVTQFET